MLVKVNETITTNETEHVNSTLAPVIKKEAVNETIIDAKNDSIEVPDISPFRTINKTSENSKNETCSCPVIPACPAVSNLTFSDSVFASNSTSNSSLTSNSSSEAKKNETVASKNETIKDDDDDDDDEKDDKYNEAYKTYTSSYNYYYSYGLNDYYYSYSSYYNYLKAVNNKNSYYSYYYSYYTPKSTVVVYVAPTPTKKKQCDVFSFFFGGC